LGLSVAASAEQQVVQVWPEGRVPLKTGDAPEKVNPSKDDIIRITDVNVPSLTVFLAADTGRPNPAVMICPGGGYGILAWNHEGTEIAAWLNGQGISAFVLKYRVPGNQRDAAFCDAQRAMGVIRSRAAAFNIDPARLGIMGFSAGAHLSARTSADAGKRFYEPVDEADALPSRPDFALIIYPAYLAQKGGFELPPEIPVSAATPPTFLLQAENDKPYVDSSLAYFIALKAAGVPAELHIFPDGGHGYGLRKKGTSTDAWGGLAEVWLKRLLTPKN
jgi:acetyl esterase/lipase